MLANNGSLTPQPKQKADAKVTKIDKNVSFVTRHCRVNSLRGPDPNAEPLTDDLHQKRDPGDKLGDSAFLQLHREKDDCDEEELEDSVSSEEEADSSSSFEEEAMSAEEGEVFCWATGDDSDSPLVAALSPLSPTRHPPSGPGAPHQPSSADRPQVVPSLSSSPTPKECGERRDGAKHHKQEGNDC